MQDFDVSSESGDFGNVWRFECRSKMSSSLLDRKLKLVVSKRFGMELVSGLRKKQNETFDSKNFYTKSLTKMNDFIDFMCGVAHFGFLSKI